MTTVFSNKLGFAYKEDNNENSKIHLFKLSNSPSSSTTLCNKPISIEYKENECNWKGYIQSLVTDKEVMFIRGKVCEHCKKELINSNEKTLINKLNSANLM